MKKSDLTSMSLDELVERFAEIGVQQDDALWDGKYTKFGVLYKQMNQIDSELKLRGTDARRALLRLYSHPNVQVRLKAAVRTFAVAPEVARRVLETIANSYLFPQAADARMFLNRLDDGTSKPE